MDIVEMLEDYVFIGNEFLTWLWFKMDIQEVDCYPGNKIVLSGDKECISIKGEDSDLIIGKVALTDGLVVTEMNIAYNSLSFTLKGSDLALNGFKTPKIKGDGSENEEEGLILENIYFVEKAFEKLDNLFDEFINVRMNNWNNEIIRIKKWVNDG